MHNPSINPQDVSGPVLEVHGRGCRFGASGGASDAKR